MSKEKISKFLKENEDIVISGIGGRFPESDTVDEFAQNLYNKVDMIVDDDRRWPTGQSILLFQCYIKKRSKGIERLNINL
jgi:hypothetical protein